MNGGILNAQVPHFSPDLFSFRDNDGFKVETALYHRKLLINPENVLYIEFEEDDKNGKKEN